MIRSKFARKLFVLLMGAVVGIYAATEISGYNQRERQMKAMDARVYAAVHVNESEAAPQVYVLADVLDLDRFETGLSEMHTLLEEQKAITETFNLQYMKYGERIEKLQLMQLEAAVVWGNQFVDFDTAARNMYGMDGAIKEKVAEHEKIVKRLQAIHDGGVVTVIKEIAKPDVNPRKPE